MVDLGGYIIILMNHNGKIKLYGSPADNADSLEVGDEILEVNGRTLENATHSEVIQHIHQCIKSRTICLRVRRRSGNKMEELDGPNAGRIRDAWVIAVERGARERLQRLTALRRIQPRDIQAILHQQISEGAASTSGSGTDADVTSSQITVTLADKDLGTNAYPTKLSNGTIPKGIPKAKGATDISAAKERKDILEKQQSCPEEANLLQPLQSAKVGERRASSPFQNGRTEVLIGEPEGGPRSPRGSTSSAANESNFLNLSEERDYPEPICRSRRRSASGVPDIHLQQGQLQENNNSSRETKESKEGLGPDEMWAPGALGHHRELPVDVPDTLLQQAYPNKVKNYSPGYRSDRRSRSASDLDLSLNLKNKRSSGENAKVGGESATLVRVEDPAKIELKIENSHFAKDKKETETEVETEKGKQEETEDTVDKVEKVEKVDVAKVTKLPNLKDIAKRAAVDEEIAGQKESSVDAEEDYPFAKEDYPTMLKTCSDDSASPRSSSGRSDSTAPLDTSLILRHRSTGKNSPLYDARRIDLGSPCRSIVPEIKIAPLFSRARDSTSFDNPAYGLADLQDLQGLLMRSDEVSDLTCLIDEQGLISGKSREQSQMSSTWSKDHVLVEGIKATKKASKRPDEQSRTRGRRDLDATNLIKCSSEDLIQVELTNVSSKNRVKKKKQSSSGYSTLKSEASTDLDQDSAFLVDANRVYREVAVDCPPDFVPVTKCHPVYPPPNKTPGNSKHNTLDSSAARSKTIPAKFNPKDLNSNGDDRGTLASPHNEIKNIEPTNNNRSSLLLADNARETVVARTVDQRGEKVRSKVKSLLFDSFPLKHSKKPAAYSTTPCSSSNNHSSNDDFNRTRDFLYQPTTLKIENITSSSSSSTSVCSSSKNSNLYEVAPTQVESVATASRCCSRQNLLETSLEPEQPLFYDNPCLDVSKDGGSAPGSPGRVTFSSFLGDDACSRNSTGDNDDSKTPSKSIANHPGFPLELSFTQETNQNSRNSFRELISRKGIPLIVYYSPKEERAQLPLPLPDALDPDRLSSVKIRGSQEDFCPAKQNQKNSRLSLEYKCFEYSKFSDHSPRSERLSRENLKANEALSKSDLDLSSALDVSIFKVHSWLSHPHLTSRSLDSSEPASSPKPDTTCTPNHSNKHATAISPSQRPPSDTPENSMYDSVHPYEDIDDIDNQQTGLNGVKPAIPPRDQKRAPARPPKDNLRLSTQNNNVEPSDNANTEPTQQQLHSIRKYQEQLRKRKDEEEKQEVLNRSLRGSRKLQALESHATSLSGQENPAYAQDELSAVTRSHISTSHATQEVEEPPRPLTYGEVVATLERLQLQLRNISGALGISGPGVEAELEAVRTLLVQRRFATALATHHALKTRLRSVKLAKHHAEDASNLARDCIEVLEQWQSSSTSNAAGDTIAAVEELTGLLTSYEMEGLLLAHDSVVSYVEGFQRKQGSLSSSPSGPPSPSSSTRGSRIADNIKIIRIEKTNEPLGATVRNEGDAVIIGRVVRGGAADKSGLLHEGDEVLEVNGVEMRGKSVNEVCDILAGMQGSLTFLVLPAPTNHRNNLSSNRREDNTQIQHVRAHFDYDPEEDPYIPCRELGVSFQKGDVLHVISQEDPNWWQAYREGEEDQTLAGLIPSRAFQHQRESMKQTIAGDKSTVRGAKKSSTLLCARKNPKKKKRNKFGSNFNDDGYPLYATTAIDDYDSEEVLTYEEVALYYPRANHKRPIVLIGPPNIGRHELRQRLMQDSERFAAAIPHTSRPRKDSEVDGQDYHFISRSQFESDILCRKFVEHGEYEKAYYGTSVEAIRSVVNSAKICVLNLHPQSLKILRSSDLKPYVVFVAPPSLEKLRQKRLKNNESFKEEELKDIIEKAREMEDKYGHLFDMIIINNDTDRAYNQLLTEINSLEREPQWVPATWVP